MILSSETTNLKATKELVKRVEAGAAYLNVVYPGWHKKVNLTKLSLSSNNTCIIGQLFNSYDDNLEDRLNIPLNKRIQIVGNGEMDQADVFGFHLDKPEDVWYELLTQIWKIKIRALKRRR